ncbi:replication factor C subunit 5-like isoform X1 [Teleopsis dalmanni]|uniref:replication factor C subunit 5-like isoform X1 n=1 Tax=Teleopsis dalmanni TaxID=139649 RepID=UPI0018CD6A35|nr:replication factor C subunit 5-like isoform X1 [Teleopsis dalmanni]
MVEESAEKIVRMPWVEKYRPAKLDDLISHEEIISTINRFINQKQLPHLLFYGPPGTGKTSTILACAKQLYTPAQFKSMVLELNASDDRGINIVRGQILNFASTRTIFSGTFKLIILDEADAMTNDAQNALRRIIEKYTENVRFCVICNYLSKIIPAVQSRCTRFRFAPLSPEQILPRLDKIVEMEKLNVTEDGKKALMTLSKGDMRKVLNVLQSTSMAFDIVNEDNVYTCVGHPLRKDIEHILQTLMSTENFETAYNGRHKLHMFNNNWRTIQIIFLLLLEIQGIKSVKGLALEDILTELHQFIMRIEIPMSVMNKLIIKLASIEERLAKGCSEGPQTTALVSAFFICREMVTMES